MAITSIKVCRRYLLCGASFITFRSADQKLQERRTEMITNDCNFMQHSENLHEKFEPTTLNMAKRAQYIGPNNIAICCAEMLRSFGVSLKKSKQSSFILKYGLRCILCLVEPEQAICSINFFGFWKVC